MKSVFIKFGCMVGVLLLLKIWMVGLKKFRSFFGGK